MAREINIDVTSSKTYATKVNMLKAIAKESWIGENTRFVTHVTDDGRFTPLFLFSSLEDQQMSMGIARHGWHVIS